MAATKSAWGGATVNNWADSVEDDISSGAHQLTKKDEEDDFPSLGAAAKMPAKQPAPKKKPQKMSLGQFVGASAQAAAAPIEDIRAMLPKSSRGKVEGEEPLGKPGLGGGFKEYGGDRGGPRGGRDREERGPRGGRDEEFVSSRADEVDDWGSTRKFEPTGDRGGPRGGGFRDYGAPREGGAPREPRPISAADEVDNWGSTKKFEPSADSGRPGFGGGRDGPRPAARGPMFEGRSKADEEDQWSRGRQFAPGEAPSTRGGSGNRESKGFGFADKEGRPNPDAEEKWGRRALPEAPAPAAAPAPGERPRLKLAPRTAVPADGKSADGKGDSKSNPFGAARPREDVLKEQGKDPVREDLKLEHGEVIRDATPAELELQAEVERLRKHLDVLKVQAQDEKLAEALEDELQSTQKLIDEKEAEFLKLQVELDDAVKYAKKAPQAAAAVDKGDGGAWGRVERRPTREEAAAADAAAAPRGAGRGGDAARDGPRDPREGGRGGGDRGERDQRGGSRAAPGAGPARGGGSKW